MKMTTSPLVCVRTGSEDEKSDIISPIYIYINVYFLKIVLYLSGCFKTLWIFLLSTPNLSAASCKSSNFSPVSTQIKGFPPRIKALLSFELLSFDNFFMRFEQLLFHSLTSLESDANQFLNPSIRVSFK